MLCVRCSTEKSASNFSQNVSSYNGYQAYCKACVSEYKFLRRYEPIALEDFEISSKRFWKKVNILHDFPEKCWEWKAGKLFRGYGCFNIKYRIIQASRASYILTHKLIPDEEIFVCHSCDNPPCCNPAHLFLGTNASNIADAVSKGKYVKKLSDTDILYIFSMKGKCTIKEISEKFNIHWRTVYSLWSNNIHKRVLRAMQSAPPSPTQGDIAVPSVLA